MRLAICLPAALRFGMLPPHPVVKQNVGTTNVCRVERYDIEKMLDAHQGDETMYGPINAGATRVPAAREERAAADLHDAVLDEGAALGDKRVPAGKDTIVAIPNRARARR